MRPRRLLAALVPLGLAALPVVSVACTSTANLSDIYMALDGEGARRRSVFFTDTKSIHCIAEGGFGRKDVTVEGHIRQVRIYNPRTNGFDDIDLYGDPTEFTPGPSTGGQPTKLDVALIQVNAKGESDEEAPYAAGSYKCEFSLDGKLAKSIDFNIDFPECPGGAILNGQKCFGFYKENTPCPANGAKSTDKPECRCRVAGWECK